SITLRIGGQVILTESDTYRHTAVHTLTDENGFSPPGPPGGGGGLQRQWTATRSDGASIEYSDIAPSGGTRELGVIREGFSSIGSTVFLRQPGYFSYGVLGLQDNLPTLMKEVVRSAPDVFGVLSRIDESDSLSYPRQCEFLPRVATRSG